MTAYEYIAKVLKEKGPMTPRWRYKGPGYGQGVIHAIALMEPYEIVTCSMTHGWLGSCDEFLKQFDLLPA